MRSLSLLLLTVALLQFWGKLGRSLVPLLLPQKKGPQAQRTSQQQLDGNDRTEDDRATPAQPQQETSTEPKPATADQPHEPQSKYPTPQRTEHQQHEQTHAPPQKNRTSKHKPNQRTNGQTDEPPQHQHQTTEQQKPPQPPKERDNQQKKNEQQTRDKLPTKEPTRKHPGYFFQAEGVKGGGSGSGVSPDKKCEATLFPPLAKPLTPVAIMKKPG